MNKIKNVNFLNNRCKLPRLTIGGSEGQNVPSVDNGGSTFEFDKEREKAVVGKAKPEKKTTAGSSVVSRQVASQSTLQKYFHSKSAKFRWKWFRSDLETILSDSILIMIYAHFPDRHAVFASLIRIIETSKLWINSCSDLDSLFFYLVHFIYCILVLDTINNI